MAFLDGNVTVKILFDNRAEGDAPTPKLTDVHPFIKNNHSQLYKKEFNQKFCVLKPVLH